MYVCVCMYVCTEGFIYVYRKESLKSFVEKLDLTSPQKLSAIHSGTYTYVLQYVCM
jgi:hypothetical protein